MRCKIMYLLVGLLIISVCHAQSPNSITDKKVNSRIAELKNNKINLIVCYYVNCIGYVKPYYPDSCNTALVKYLLWKDGGRSYIQRFDDCLDYKPTAIRETFMDEVANNLTAIKKADIKYPQYVIIRESKKDTLNVIVDHSCHYIFSISTLNEKIIKDIDDFALDTKELDDYSGNIKDEPKKRHNDNYEKNQLSILVKLKNMAEQITNGSNKKGPVNGAF